MLNSNNQQIENALIQYLKRQYNQQGSNLMSLYNRLYFFMIIILLSSLQIQAQQCPSFCSRCFKNVNSPSPNLFTCQQCNQIQTIYQYLSTCQINEKYEYYGFYLALCIVVVILHLFCLFIGFGVYQVIYQDIQLISIFVWVAVSKWSIYPLQGTNFAIEKSNNFMNTFGVQFLFLIFTIILFFFFVASSQRYPHNRNAILIKRKRIIFPVRICSLVYQILVFSSLTSIYFNYSLSNSQVFELFLSIVGLGASVCMYLAIFYLCNFKRFKLDDINYYVVYEKMVSTRWWAKNKLFFQYTRSTILIISFVLGFSNPTITILVMIVIQSIFTIYLLIFISYTKLRYKIFTVLSSFLLIIVLSIQYVLANSILSSHQITYSNETAYTASTFVLCFVFITGVIIELVAQRHRIMRQLRSFKNRFITCEKMQEEIEEDKYGSTGSKRVEQFNNNEIYGLDLSEIRENFNLSLHPQKS